MAEESSRTPPQVRRTKHNFEPGVAKEPPEFHEGKHTTPYAKVNPLGMKTMFDTTDHATKRMMEMKLLDRSVSDANWQMAQARRAQRRPRDSLPAPTGLASDPWDDRKPVSGRLKGEIYMREKAVSAGGSQHSRDCSLRDILR